jgi:hypothetical protein
VNPAFFVATGERAACRRISLPIKTLNDHAKKTRTPRGTAWVGA